MNWVRGLIKKVTLVGSDERDLSRAYSSVGGRKEFAGTFGVRSIVDSN